MENSNTFHQMRAVTRHIEGVPKEWQSTNDWDSHRELLWLATEKTNGGWIEFGGGYGSTFLLKDKLGDWFTSFDNNVEWCKKTGARFVKDYLAIRINGCKDNLKCLFIDCAPGEIRKELIEKWKDTPIIILHDTEPDADYVYGMSEILSTFKYRLDYQPEGKPHTTAVSNAVNVCSWI